MNFEEFVKKYNGKATDYDGGYGVQCVDLAKFYVNEVLKITPQVVGNAHCYYDDYERYSYLYDNFDKIPNTPAFVPQKGDLMVWNTKRGNGAGHISLCDGVGTTSYFYSYDQNWNGEKAMRRVKHDYSNVLGVIRPKAQEKVNCPSIGGAFEVGQAVEVCVPVGIAFTEGDRCLVDDGENQFWIHKSVIREGKEIVARAIVCYVEEAKCIVQVFEEQFWCRVERMKKL